MKYIVTLLLLTIHVSFATAQDDGKTTGLYYLHVGISEELTTEFKATANDRSVLNGYSESAIFPDSLLDSVRIVTEAMLTEKLNSLTECTYRVNKKGKTITSVGANNELEGMPINTFKNALLQSDHDQYVKVSCMFNTGGSSVDLGATKRSKVKPKVTVVVTVFDRDKNEIYKGKATLKDFGKLRQKERTRGNVTVKHSETLTPADIFMMYEMALIEALSN